jgi:hypothetical protein
MPPHSLPEDIKKRVLKLRRRLGDPLKRAYIPAGLKDAIEQDPAFSQSLDMEPIDAEAYDYNDQRTPADFALADTLQHVRTIFHNATLCTQFGRDENAWCFGVIWPLIQLAIRLHGNNKWCAESVYVVLFLLCAPLTLQSIPNHQPPLPFLYCRSLNAE